jgi:ABC-type glycerol-3-phosphate transport system substrate-binding protein
MVDGQLYGLVFKAANKSTVWYNVQALSDAGVEPPATWDAFLEAGNTLQASGVPPFSIGGADGWTLTDWFENIYLRTAGPEKYDQLTTHDIPWTDESVVTALTELAKIFGQDNLIAGGRQGALQTDFPTSVSQVFTDPPAAAIVFEGDFVAGVITDQTDAAVGTDADFFPFPSINDSPKTVVAGGDTAVLMKDSEAGKAFLQFLATPEASEVWVKLGGFSSPNKNVDLSLYPDEVSGRAAEELATAEVVRFDMSDLAPAAFGGTPAQGEWKILQDFLRDSSDIQGTAQQLENAAAQAYGAGATTTTAGEATTTTSG